MGADVSRVRSNPLLDFAGVELKQGGVVLDADFNELVAVVDRRLRAAASDILGRATVSSTTPDAFKIAAVPGDLTIGKGRLYVDGLLAENHGAVSTDVAKKLFDPLMAEPAFADPGLYSKQPYLPNVPISSGGTSLPSLPTAGKHLVYLDVWDREVTHIERPDLVEVAVGVESSSRVQTVWQVRVLIDDAGTATCVTADDDVPGWASQIAPSTGRLTTDTFDAVQTTDPCELPPTGGYRGLENQTYRVEIHDPGQPGGTATFKWSRDNGSVATRVSSVISATELELQTLGRDAVLRFNTGDWVEILDDVREFSQQAGEMRKITVNEAARRVTFTPALPAAMIPAVFPDSSFPRDRNLRVRRWDQKHEVLRTGSGGTTPLFQDLDAGTSGVINVPAAGTTLLLESGITLGFASTGTKGFRAGDYWVIAARTADGSVEHLTDAPPRGIHHHYARLGIWDVAAGTVTDCRNGWPPDVQAHDCSCTACVSAESHASGQLTIQDAVNKVLETGGTVCLGPGQYALTAPVRVINGRSIRIRGQGPATVVSSPGTAFDLRNSIAVAIEHLSIVSVGQQSAIVVSSVLGLALQHLLIAVAGTTDTRGAGIALQGVVAGAAIRDNAILAPVGVLAIEPVAATPAAAAEPGPNFLLAALLAIENNLLWCQRQGVALTGNVLHLLGTHIVDNELALCGDTAISALGLGAQGSSLAIRGNSLNITGNGIRTGLDSTWIENNKLFNTVTSARASQTSGIGLATGLDKNGIDRCQILANQVTGFSLAAIVIGSPTRDLIVKLNIIDGCGNGIISADDANAGSVSIENNHLRNITGITVGGDAGGTEAVGIGVLRAEAATIAGNTIRALGVQIQRSTLTAAILTFGVLHSRVSDNEVTEVATSDFLGVIAGIMLRAPFLQFEIASNLIRRDPVPVAQPGRGEWFAVLAADLDQQSPVVRTGRLSTVRLDATRVLVVGAGRLYVASLAGAAATDVAEQARGSILGNVLNARGTSPAVRVMAAGECLFNDNRVELRGSGDRLAGVSVSTSVAIVNANRVRGGDPSIQLIGGASSKTAAVLGNITTGAIEIPGGLTPPWDALNLRG
jgi:hypothetical protein